MSKNSDYVARINKVVWGDVGEDEPTLNIKKKATKYAVFITENELVVLPYFSPGMPQEVPVSLSEISDVIDHEGLFGILVKR